MKVASSKTSLAWWALLAAYSLQVLTTPNSGVLPLVHLPFLVVVPGYAFVSVFFPKLNTLDAIVSSLVGSLSLEVGITSAVRVFSVQGTAPALSIVSAISAICFLLRLARLLWQRVRVSTEGAISPLSVPQKG